MKTCKFHLTNLTRIAALVLIAASLFLTGCQPDERYEYPAADSDAEIEHNGDTDPVLRRFILSAVYDIPVDQMSTEQADQIYRNITSQMSEPEQVEVNTQLRTLAAQMEEPGDKPRGQAKSGGETVIPGTSANFGTAIDQGGGMVFVGDPDENRVVVYINQNGSYVEQQVLTPSSGTITQFGKSVSVDGNWLAIGAGAFFEGGSVYLYRREGGFSSASATWEEHTVLTTTDQFGFANDVVVSWPYLAVLGRSSSNFAASKITMYKFFAQRWTEQDQIGDGNTFFWDIDLDGGWLAANGGQGPVGPIFNPQVFTYRPAGYFSSEWMLTQQLPFPSGQLLLRAVAIDLPNIIANTAIPGNQTSAFRLQGWGSSATWAEAGTLVHPGFPPAFVQTRWLDVQGNTAVVCEPRGEFGPPFGVGPEGGDVINVYERTNGTWQFSTGLMPTDGGLGNYVGVSPVLNGNQVYVGAPQLAGTDPGKVYIFE